MGDFETVDKRIEDALIEQLGFLNVVDIPKIEHPLLDFLEHSAENKEAYFQASKDPNLMIQWMKYKTVEKFEPESKYKNAFLNAMRLNVILFNQNPWWRSRKGWEMWFDVSAANPESYYPMGWENLYDPRNWYKVGEPRRAAHGGDTERGSTATHDVVPSGDGKKNIRVRPRRNRR